MLKLTYSQFAIISLKITIYFNYRLKFLMYSGCFQVFGTVKSTSSNSFPSMFGRREVGEGLGVVGMLMGGLKPLKNSYF